MTELQGWILIVLVFIFVFVYCFTPEIPSR
jgi:hypothetical protein